MNFFCHAQGLRKYTLKLLPYTPTHIFFTADTLERGANAVGMSIQPPATNEREDRERINKQIMRGYRGPN